MLEQFNDVFFHSGNMLDIDEIKSKTGITSTIEIKDCLRIAMEKGKRIEGEKALEIYNITPGSEIVDAKELLTNVKIFLKTPTTDALKCAVNSLRSVLYNMSLDSVIIWYPYEMTEEPTEELLELWNVLGEFVTAGEIRRLGIADVETKVFVSLYEKVKVKPAIFHLTVQNCCMVPPDLQQFAEKKEIQLLTHYDPQDILPPGEIPDMLKIFNPYWIARYQSHIKCRGVLAKKGYLAHFRQII